MLLDFLFFLFFALLNDLVFSLYVQTFAAMSLVEHPKVVSVFLNKGRKLHTTRSWNFLGLEDDGLIRPSSIWTKARFGEDTIIGNLDTG